MKRLILICSVMLLPVGLAAGESAPAAGTAEAGSAQKLADIRRLLELAGSKEAAEKMMETMLSVIKPQALPDTPEELWEELRREFRPEVMLELAVPIWDRHFTHDDIREYIKFYETPAGRKLAAQYPELAQQSFLRGARRGQEIVERFLERLRARGYLKT